MDYILKGKHVLARTTQITRNDFVNSWEKSRNGRRENLARCQIWCDQEVISLTFKLQRNERWPDLQNDALHDTLSHIALITLFFVKRCCWIGRSLFTQTAWANKASWKLNNLHDETVPFIIENYAIYSRELIFNSKIFRKKRMFYIWLIKTISVIHFSYKFYLSEVILIAHFIKILFD